jgi:transcriptional regulator with GAF, ATPase, and Fis domain
MRELFAVLERVAPSDSLVLIEAETGTGKELCAAAIHQYSARKKGPFVVCDLAGMARSLIESDLFGHERGAFTGAVGDHTGAFESAQGGTLFLDELGELELELQPRLLRAIESHKIRRLGSSAYRNVDVRVIAATNRDLDEEVKAGTFRSDLLHRLAVVRLRIPPLRERKEDLPLLCEHLLSGSGRTLSQLTLSLLSDHDWPGNVRELRNVLERALVLDRSTEPLGPEALGLVVGGNERPIGTNPGYHEAKEQLIAQWERAFVERILSQAGGNVSQAARSSGLGRRYLHRLIRKYDLPDSPRQPR